jgi:small subunit ribosomal protein S9
LEKLQNK